MQQKAIYNTESQVQRSQIVDCYHTYHRIVTHVFVSRIILLHDPLTENLVQVDMRLIVSIWKK